MTLNFPDHFSLMFGTFPSLFFVVAPQEPFRSDLRFEVDVFSKCRLYGESVNTAV